MISTKSIEIPKPSFSRILIVLATISSVLLINWFYFYDIAETYRYLNFNPKNEFNILGRFFFGFMACFPSLWLTTKTYRPSQAFLWIFYFIVYIPAVSFAPCTSLTSNFEITVLLLSLVSSILILHILSHIPLVSVSKPATSAPIFWSIVIFSLLLLLIYFSVSNHLSLSMPNLLDVYPLRKSFAAFLESSPKIVSYWVSTQANAINPLILICGLVHKRPLLIFFGIFGQFFIFVCSGMKSVLFSIVFILIVFALLKRKGNSFARFLSMGVAFSLAAIVFVGFFIDTSLLSAIFVRRVFVVPGIVTGFYHDFFSSHPLVLLSDGILSPFVPYEFPFDRGVPKLIGDTFIGKEDFHVNVHFLSNSFMHFGYLGMLFFSFIWGLISWFFDSLSRNQPLFLSGTFFCTISFSLANSGLLTSLLSHGILIAVLLFYFLPQHVVRAKEDGHA